jgi:hypothetical protein
MFDLHVSSNGIVDSYSNIFCLRCRSGLEFVSWSLWVGVCGFVSWKVL